MIKVRRADERGVSERGWLSSRHTFSFGEYYDPQQLGFSDLLVINDDRIIGGRGFGQHPHRDIEIVSYVLEGALEHKDTLATAAVIHTGDVQMMSAGTGIAHSESNHSETDYVHFLQIWILPDRRGLSPRYQQARFPLDSKRGNLRLIISPDGQDGSLGVYQDVRVYAGLFDGAESQMLEIPDGRHAYAHVARGTVVIDGHALGDRDGARVRKQTRLNVSNGEDAELLVFDLRPHESPQAPRESLA